MYHNFVLQYVLYCQCVAVEFDIGVNLAIYISVIPFFFCLCSSDGENGTDEKRKAGKSPTMLLQTSASEMEYFDDRKKLDVAR